MAAPLIDATRSGVKAKANRKRVYQCNRCYSMATVKQLNGRHKCADCGHGCKPAWQMNRDESNLGVRTSLGTTGTFRKLPKI